MADRPTNVALYCVYLVALNAGDTPSGHLYAMAMKNGVNLDQHLHVISLLKQSGHITETNHLLSITDKGRALTAKLDAVIEAAS